jgi:serine/threonine protein kinase
MQKLNSSWKACKRDYKLTEVVGEGSVGLVVKARHRVSNIQVAIKKIDCSFDDLLHMKYVLRELTILRQLSEMEGNEFTIKLYDVIIPEIAYEDVMKLKTLFFVMEYVPYDMTSILSTASKSDEKTES